MPRMFATFALAFIAIPLAFVTPTKAADPPPASDSVISSPEKLLASLSNPDWRERRDAIHQLIQLGPAGDEAVKNLLRRNLDHEQRKNVGLALQLIQDNRLFGPSLITLHVNGAPASDVVKSIGAQADAKLPVYPTDLLNQFPRVTLNLDHVPFWDAMRELSNQLNIDYLSDSQELKITRGPGRLPAGTISHGAFLLTAQAVTMRRGMSLELNVYPEPKITILRTTDLKLERAVDDHGNPLTSQSGRGFRGGRGFGGGRFGGYNPVRNGPRTISGIFQRPPDADKIAELRGQFTVCVQGGTARWEINEPLNVASVSRTVDAIPVTIESFTGHGENYLLKASIPFGWSGDPQINEINDLMKHDRLRAYDAAGRQLTAGSPDQTPFSETTEFEVTFSTRSLTGEPPTGPPAKLVWDIPEKTRDVIIPFQFKSIPIEDGF